MLKGALSYQASYFGGFQEYAPTAETIPPLLRAFSAEEFLPTTYAQISAGSANTRLRLAPPGNEWVVDIDVHRINVVKNPTEPWGRNMGAPEDFARSAAEFVARVLAVRNVPGSRLALVTKEFLDLSGAGQLEAAYRKLVKPLAFYVAAGPHEWKVRSTARVEKRLLGRREQINTITELSRLQGSFGTPAGVEEFDAITVDFDINTFQETTLPRFDASSLAEFIPLALGLREQLLTDIGVHLED